MKRPEQHVTADKGITQVRTAFESFGWTVEPIIKDYGADLNVEVFANGETTGVTFKVQVKSSEATTYSQDCTHVSEQISRPNAKYWAAELRTPVVLVHADINSGQSFWILPQLDKSILQFLEQTDKDTISVHIPTSNHVSNAAEQLLDSLAQAETVLAARSITGTTVLGFLQAIEGRIDKEQVFCSLKNKSDALGIARAEEFVKSGPLDQVIADMERAISDAKATVENRFWAVLVLERAEVVKASQVGRMADLPQIQMSVCVRLKEVSRHGPHHLKFYCLIAKLAAQLHVLTSREFMLYINDKINRASQVDKFWQSVLRIERARLTRAIVRKFEQCLRVIGYSLNSDSLGALPHAMVRVIMGITPFVHQLKEEDPAAADAYVQSAFAISRLAADVALLTGDEDTAGWVAGYAACLVPGGTTEITSWAEGVIKKIKDETRRAYFAENLREALEIASKADKKLAIVEEQEIYRRMADAQGINLADPNDPIAKIVNIGISDFDPTRVLRNCRHLFVTIGSIGLPGQWLCLPTAGSKVLHCTLKRKSIGGISLDGLYTSFKSEYCDGCNECKPHPVGWSYTHEWQLRQNELHKEFIYGVEPGN
jgi:Domain of unknown function (DUF4365)